MKRIIDFVGASPTLSNGGASAALLHTAGAQSMALPRRAAAAAAAAAAMATPCVVCAELSAGNSQSNEHGGPPSLQAHVSTREYHGPIVRMHRWTGAVVSTRVSMRR